MDGGGAEFTTIVIHTVEEKIEDGLQSWGPEVSVETPNPFSSPY